MIILINAGERVLTVPQMEELEAQAEAKAWYQIAMPPLTEDETKELEQEIAAIIAKLQRDGVSR